MHIFAVTGSWHSKRINRRLDYDHIADHLQGRVTFDKANDRTWVREAGGRLAEELLPGGRVALRAATTPASIGGLNGPLEGKSPKAAMLDEVDEATKELERED